uniref:Aminoalcoholphosphotransferase (AAPT1) mRNA n=1 Tax=Glycine max TaxID=3847 RepID=V9GZY5_SOYBN|nr:hypothetical protein - soybean [Glycine max]AAA67718.1 ORF [Glycine max]
MKMVRCCRCFA